MSSRTCVPTRFLCTQFGWTFCIHNRAFYDFLDFGKFNCFIVLMIIPKSYRGVGTTFNKVVLIKSTWCITSVHTDKFCDNVFLPRFVQSLKIHILRFVVRTSCPQQPCIRAIRLMKALVGSWKRNLFLLVGSGISSVEFGLRLGRY